MRRASWPPSPPSVIVAPAAAFSVSRVVVSSSGIGSSRVRQRANSTISVATRSISASYRCMRRSSRSQGGEARVEIVLDIGRQTTPGVEALARRVVGEQDRAVGELRRVTAEFAQFVTYTDHGRDVLHGRSDSGRVGRLVYEIHPTGRPSSVVRVPWDDHRVEPLHAALIGDHEANVGPLPLQLHDVARPCEAQREVATAETVTELVARELADLPVALGRFELFERPLGRVTGGPRRI